MSNSYKERFYSTSYLWKEDYHAGGDDGIVGVGHRTTHFYSPKVCFGRYRHNGESILSHSERTSSLKALISIRDYSDHATGDSTFVVAAGYIKGGVDNSTTHLNYQTFYCYNDGSNVVLSRSNDY